MKRKLLTTKNAPPADKRVLIVDDHPFMRMGLTESLGREPGLCVCAAFGTAEEALTAIEKLKPDVIITDLNLPGKGGLELIKDIAAMWPKLPTIALSMHDEDIYAQRCLRAGARGYVMKNEGPEKLAAAVRHVLAGGTYVSAETASRIVDIFTGHTDREKSAPIAQLTDREFDVFQLIGRGLSTQEIADRLHLSVKTVETHRMHIKTKLHIGSTTELTAYAARWVAATG